MAWVMRLPTNAPIDNATTTAITNEPPSVPPPMGGDSTLALIAHLLSILHPNLRRACSDRATAAVAVHTVSA
jgi:hypothetical protein